MIYVVIGSDDYYTLVLRHSVKKSPKSLWGFPGEDLSSTGNVLSREKKLTRGINKTRKYSTICQLKKKSADLRVSQLTNPATSCGALFAFYSEAQNIPSPGFVWKKLKKNREESITSRHLSPEWERGWGRRFFLLKIDCQWGGIIRRFLAYYRALWGIT